MSKEFLRDVFPTGVEHPLLAAGGIARGGEGATLLREYRAKEDVWKFV